MAEASTIVTGGEGGQQGAQGAQGAQGGDPWFSSYDEDTKGFVTAKGWDKLDPNAALAEAVKGYRGAESKLGVPADQILKLPGKDAKPEDWKPVWQRLGAPETPEGYELPVPDGHDPEFAKAASAWFHELGVPKQQAAGLAQKWNEHVMAVQAQQEGQWNQRFDQELAALKGEWKGDEYDKNVDLAKRVMKTAGFNEDQMRSIERALGPKAMLQSFAKFGAMVGEHRFVGGNQAQNFGMSTEGAKERIATLKKDSAYMAAYVGGDADKIAEMTRLHQIAFPEQQAA